MSRVQTTYIPVMDAFDSYVKSLCHMARLLDTSKTNYGKMKQVVLIGTSKRVVESYVRHLLGAKELPHNLICFGVDEAPVSHKEFTYSGSHVVLMHDLSYICENTMNRVSQRVIEMILSLKQMPDDVQVKNTSLFLVYQNPQLWSMIKTYGSLVQAPNKHIQYREGLVSSIDVGQFMACKNNEDYHKLHAPVITIGLEFFCIKPDELLAKLGNLMWSLASTASTFKDTYKIVLHDDFRLAFFEEFLLGDHKGF